MTTFRPPCRAHFISVPVRATTTGLPSHRHSATSGKRQTLDDVCERVSFSLPCPPWRTSGTTLTTCSQWGPLRTSHFSRRLCCQRGGSTGSRLELLPPPWWDQVMSRGCPFVMCLEWSPGGVAVGFRDNALSSRTQGCRNSPSGTDHSRAGRVPLTFVDIRNRCMCR